MLSALMGSFLGIIALVVVGFIGLVVAYNLIRFLFVFLVDIGNLVWAFLLVGAISVFLIMVL